MLEIKTIVTRDNKPEEFDQKVNEALKEGWVLVRRDVLPAYAGGLAEYHRCYYAELERQTEPEEEEEPEDDTTAEWELVRDPVNPFRCSKCSCKSDDAPKTCPVCGRRMTGVL